MAIIQSDYAKGIKDTPYPAVAGEAITHRFEMTVPASAALNDILDLGIIPAGCRVHDMVLDADDLDTGGSPALALDVGIMSGSPGDTDARTCGAEFIAASTVGQAGGSVRPSLKTAFRTGVSATARSIGVKIQTAAATPAAGTIGLTVTYGAV